MVEIVTADRAGELDAFVRAHPRGHFMQTSLWGRVKADWPWLGLICRARDGEIRGTMALLRHSLRLPHACLLYAPRGPILDPTDYDVLRELTDAAVELGRTLGACTLRLDPEIPEADAGFRAAVLEMGFRIQAATDYSLYQPRLTYVSRLDGKDEQSLLASFRRSTRYNVRKALRGPLTVRQGGAADLPSFQRMMEQTAAQNGFQPRTQAYYASVLRGLGRCGQLYLAELDGAPVAAAITATLGRGCWFLYSCSDREGRDLHANELLQWRMQTDALRAGCARFDFRGVEGYPTEDNPKLGLHQYKQGLGGEFCAWIGQLDLPLRPFVSAAELRLEQLSRRMRSGVFSK